MTSERRILACPSCGAALPPSAAGRVATCPFCGVTTEPAPAPIVERVVQQVVREVVYVQAPAGAAPTEPAAAVTSRKCPRCQAALFETWMHGVRVDGCGACGGIWLDNTGTRAAMERADPQLLELSERAEKHATSHPERPAVDLPCAECGQPMQRTLIGGTTLVLDVCPAHGTWFDAHELQIFSRAYTLPAGGTFWSYEPAAPGDDLRGKSLVGLLGVLADRTFGD